MTAQEILNKWLDFTGYDENQQKFNMLSSNYYFHRATEQMKKAMRFDDGGTLAVLYAKQSFMELCKELKISLFDLFSDPDACKGEKEMWDILMSEDVRAVEENLLNSVDTLVRSVVPTQLLGDRDINQERETLLESIGAVVEELEACREDLFLKGTGPIEPISYFSTSIHVFDRLSSCLLAMERSDVKDGLYLCFIRNDNTAECYFAFLLKSNGNLLSVSERVEEAYPGQHGAERNGHWSNKKAFNLFPYKYVIDCDDYDYKGYAHTQVINEEKTAFFRLEAGAYMPILLAMVCLNNKYAGMCTDDMEVKLVDTLLSWNVALPSPAAEALTVPSDSAIAEISGMYQRQLTSEQVRTGALHEKYKWKNLTEAQRRAGVPHGEFGDEENIFAQLYGEGFELDTSALLVTDPHLRLTAGDAEKQSTPNVEFVASSATLDLIAYQQGRQQLAAYIRSRMWQEYLDFGGAEAVDKWWKAAVDANKEHIFQLCVAKYLKSGNVSGAMLTGSIRFIDNPESCGGGYHPFNRTKLDASGRQMYGKYLCSVTGSLCSLGFCFEPRDWKELEQLVGPLPKLVMGWRKDGHWEEGNPILHVTDAVSGIGTLFETREQEHHPELSYNHSAWWENVRPRTDFKFYVAFSKRGFAQMLKKYSDIGKEKEPT